MVNMLISARECQSTALHPLNPCLCPGQHLAFVPECHFRARAAVMVVCVSCGKVEVICLRSSTCRAAASPDKVNAACF